MDIRGGGDYAESSFRIEAKNYQGDINPQNQTSAQIAQFLKERNITKLLHFTDESNLDNILNFGLLSRKILDNLQWNYSFNDEKRLDKRLDCISLSMSRINRKLLDLFIEKNKIDRCIIIAIDATMLYREDNERIYCQTNAATKRANKGSEFKDLVAMFDDEVSYHTNYDGILQENKIKRNGQCLNDNKPTAPQAEILWKDWVNPNYISGWCYYDGNICYKIEEVEHYEKCSDYIPSWLRDAGYDDISQLTDSERNCCGSYTKVTKSEEEIFDDEFYEYLD